MELKLLKNKSIIKIFLIFILTSFNILKAFSQEEEVGKIDNIIGKAEVFRGKETVELKKGDLFFLD